MYSFIMSSRFTETGALGFITMIAILTTDVIVFFINNAEIVRTSTPLCLILFMNRFFLIIFGGRNWIYGYIVIYIFYAVFLCVIIAKKRFRFEDSVKGLDIEKMLDSKKDDNNNKGGIVSSLAKTVVVNENDIAELSRELTFFEKLRAFIRRCLRTILGL